MIPHVEWLGSLSLLGLSLQRSNWSGGFKEVGGSPIFWETYIARWWQLKCFLCSSPQIGEDEPILTNMFQRGWNPFQPDRMCWMCMRLFLHIFRQYYIICSIYSWILHWGVPFSNLVKWWFSNVMVVFSNMLYLRKANLCQLSGSHYFHKSRWLVSWFSHNVGHWRFLHHSESR